MSLERTDPPAAADEVATLRGFLDYYRVTLRRQTDGLTQEQLSTPLPTSPLTLGGMVKHLTFVEHWWFHVVHTGGEAQGIWADVDWEADEDWDWHSAVHDPPDQLRGWHEAEVVRSQAVLDAALARDGLDQLSERARHGRRASLRWILVHLIEEYARHAGHGDLIREAIDGEVGL